MNSFKLWRIRLKKSYVSFLGAVAALAVFASCGSTPKAPATEVEEPVEAPVEEDSAEQEADNFSALEKAEAARQAAVDAGADTVAAEQFAAADALFQSIKVLSESGKDVSKELADVQTRFTALEQYAKALKSKKKIEDNDFISYDQASYDSGCNSLAELERLFVNPAATSEDMLAAAKAARGSFDNVLFKAYKALAKDARAAAFSAKKDADGVKAGAAAKAEYSAAVEEFKAGDTSYSMQNPESALSHYTASKAQFESVYATVSVKREAAQKAMDEAKAKVAESQNYAQAADEKAPLSGDDVQGIEAADAVLLEADEYENPQGLEADVPEVIEEAAADLEDAGQEAE